MSDRFSRLQHGREGHHGGRWHDRQLISPEFLKETLSPQIDMGSGWKYGYQWWLYPDGSRTVWAARGFGGQQLLIFPEDDLIVVTTAWDILAETHIFQPILAKVRAAVSFRLWPRCSRQATGPVLRPGRPIGK